MVMRDSFAESSRMNHLMRQKSAAFRKKRGFRVQQDPELRAAFGRRRLLELFVSAEDSVSREEIHGQLSVLATVGALIAGFSVATSLAVEHDEVLAYVQWEATMFLGWPPPGSTTSRVEVGVSTYVCAMV